MDATNDLDLRKDIHDPFHQKFHVHNEEYCKVLFDTKIKDDGSYTGTDRFESVHQELGWPRSGHSAITSGSQEEPI